VHENGNHEAEDDSYDYRDVKDAGYPAELIDQTRPKTQDCYY
jgi:hypothetical protein